MTIEEYCKLKGITQNELAEMLGISPAYLSKIKYNSIFIRQSVKDKLNDLGIEVSSKPFDIENGKKTERIAELELENKALRQILYGKIESIIKMLKQEEIMRKEARRNKRKEKDE